MVRKRLGVSPVAEYFSNSGTVNVPTGVDGCWIYLQGAGGGGGGGVRSSSTLNARYGGEGGEGGNVVRDLYIPASLLGTTYTVTVSSTGGTSGAGSITNGTAGTAGGRGGSTSFASGSSTWTASGGIGGQGGYTSATAPVSSSFVTGTNQATIQAAAAGPNYGSAGSVPFGGAPAAASSGDSLCMGAAGGGAGGGFASGSSVVANGSAGGKNFILGNFGGGAGGIAGGAAATAGTAVPAGFAGAGAGGGASNAATGLAGATAVGYGGGGGGGGAGSSTAGGAGGAGAPGYARILWDYRSDKSQLGAVSYSAYGGATSTGAVTVPSGIKGCWVYMIGCGGGGGAGSVAATTSTHLGGQGGFGGCVTFRWISAAILGATYTVTIPSNRTGGAGSTAATGNSGQAMAQTTFASGSYTLYCDGGQPGAGGNVLGSVPPFPGMDSLSTFAYDLAGGGGAVSSYQPTPTTNAFFMTGEPGNYAIDNDLNGFQDYGAAAGGGAGGYVNWSGSATTFFVGSGGGYVRTYGISGGVGGTGVVAATSGVSSPIGMIPGPGAGGGAAQTAATGQSGAAGVGYGAGGGGGGAACTGSSSGSGGAGGPGYVRIFWDYI